VPTQIVCTDRNDWLQQRRLRGIGASEAAVILGLAKYKSPFALYHEKLGLEAPSPAETEAAEWGLILEEPIATRFERDTNRHVYAPPPHSIFIHDSLPWMLASLDRVTEHEINGEKIAVPLELKTADASLRAEWKDEIPLSYMIQVQHQIAVFDTPSASIAALVGGNTFYWADVQRDQAFIDALIEQEEAFWQRCIAHNPPDVDASKSTAEALRALYGRDNGQLVQLPMEALDWDSDFQRYKLEMDDAEGKYNLAKHRIIEALKEASAGQLPNGTVFTYKAQTRPAGVTKESTFRVLRRKGGGK
jgi:putative phage-type endonuclease